MRLIIEKISAERVLFFRELTKDLIKYKMYDVELDDKGFIWRNGEGLWILYQEKQDLKNGKIWINYSIIWSFFEKEFNMNDHQIIEFLKERLWLDKKIRVNTTHGLHLLRN